MRILHVNFNNLNSLAGRWAIDFTDPIYLSEGIFAVTGPNLEQFGLQYHRGFSGGWRCAYRAIRRGRGGNYATMQAGPR